MSRCIKQAGSALAGLLWATSVVGCAQEEDLPAEDVDQPSPTDWQSQGALMTAPSKAPRTIAAMMFDIGGGVPNAATIMSVIGGTGSSQRHMFQEISYGIQDTQPEYFGPYTLPVNNCLTIACCGPSSDQTGNGATVQMEMDALGKTFNHYFWVYGTIPSGANCGTWGDEGSPSRIAVYSSYSFHQIVGYAQEIGHNFGMTHEPTMCCGGTVSGNRTCSGGTTFVRQHGQLPAHGVRQLAVVHGRRRAPPVGGPQVPPGLDERLQPGQGRHQHDDHAAAAGAAVRRRPAAADSRAQDARRVRASAATVRATRPC